MHRESNKILQFEIGCSHSNDTAYSFMSKHLLSTSVKEGLKQSDQGCESKIFYVKKYSYPNIMLALDTL